MTRVFRTLAALLALGFVAALAQSGYYPARVGLRWSYSNGEVQEYTGTRVVNGRTVLVLTHTVGGRAASEDYVQVGPAGVSLLGSSAGGRLTWYSPPLTVYPAGPLLPGARWSSSSRGPSGVVAYTSRVLASEGVVTPAGRYNALVIRTAVTTSSGAASVSDLYFVPTVGTVRFVTQDGSKVDLVGR